jgi:glutamine amidotransferase
MQSDIIIIDYGMGNLRSVQKKFNRIGANAIVTNNSDEIEQAKKLVLPGVGSFDNGVRKLKEYALWDVIQKRVMVDKIPILGICLGMQLMAVSSEEGIENGFAWFDAEVKKFSVNDKLKFKVPHMGWNQMEQKKESILLKDLPSDAYFYFVHSFHYNSRNQEDVLGTTVYEYEFASAIEKENIYGVQFHPEKSHEWGEMMFENFLKL